MHDADIIIHIVNIYILDIFKHIHFVYLHYKLCLYCNKNVFCENLILQFNWHFLILNMELNLDLRGKKTNIFGLQQMFFQIKNYTYHKL